MYEYRKLTPEQRRELVQERLARGYPPHSPPHPVRDQPYYLLTAACYGHGCHMDSASRRHELLDELFDIFISQAVELRAWVVLPNHYHLLAQVPDFDALCACFRVVHARMALHWNREDASSGRKVWYRFTDRAIRSVGHYNTTLNYIHYNPVKHGWSLSPYDWPESSVSWYLAHFGREWLRDLWVTCPVRNYGRGWDDLALTNGQGRRGPVRKGATGTGVPTTNKRRLVVRT
jgi:putative transposase